MTWRGTVIDLVVGASAAWILDHVFGVPTWLNVTICVLGAILYGIFIAIRSKGHGNEN